MESNFITSIIVVRNEEDYIEICLRSLIEQDYPNSKYEIIIVDGDSDDKTLDLINKTIQQYDKHNLPNIRIMNNPKRNLASGWNIAIQNAVGEYTVRIDAHSKANKDFISKSMETMQNVKDACCVGGLLTTKSLTPTGETISKVLSSPFGIGNSKFRYSSKAQYTDTVAFGLYRKSIFEKVGYFDETLARNQDNNMHARIRNSGGKFYFNPDIKCVYYSRDSCKKMIKQAYLNGKWNIITAKINRSAVSIRHLVPLAFVISLILLISLSLINKYFIYLLFLELIAYVLCAIIFALKKTRNLIEVIKMIVLYFSLHISYGIGSLSSILKVK